jgi:hypothetical protein
MLSPNQAILLNAIAHATAPVSATALMAMRKDNGDVFGESAARNACKRMESNGWIVSSGVGQTRTFAPTHQGNSVLAEYAPLPPQTPPPATNGTHPASSDSGPKKQPRPYNVLEELTLAEVYDELFRAFEEENGNPPSREEIRMLMDGKQVYDLVAVPQARNTEHALRQVAREIYAESGEPPTLIAVAGKMWQPTKVYVNQGLSIKQEPA